MLADRLAHYAVEVGADTVGAALVDGVAGAAFGEDFFTGSRIGAGQKRAEVGTGIGAAFFFRTFDEEAPFPVFEFLMPVGVEIHARSDGCAERDDAGKENPAGSGVETIVHCVKACENPCGLMVARRSSATGALAQVPRPS